ncbi:MULTISPECIES: cation-translocating P-type ATPase [Methanoculleus]|jgi:Cd2+/Zn2+-exporting ATPase|uniref:Cd2+/Zn2+-exporting ATPase n=1 Tax=Methanoculleus thermophilus TaxID=2200 RepID=A0A1G9AE37_9EURY|nr:MULTISPECIES: cation-translocating P-type ATPase [Methanoculleus]NLN08584.1 cation-translocating P-type ATPase [Methanoculleus thermophilus]SDK25637.1 Cd2+/Zn2+-exporting ATPase [Methanoculleus thermophilus]HQD26190.1 cation-translocating P-type ATPase [Methanoculleus thermophilus]
MAGDDACPSCPRCRAGVCEIHRPAITRRQITIFAVSGALLLLGIFIEYFTPYPFIGTILLLAAAIISGYEVLRSGFLALIRLQFSISVLISIAAAGAFLTGNPAEGATVLYLYAIAEFLEEYAAGRAERSIASLLEIAPQTARVRRGDGEVIVPVGEVGVGEIAIVRPGDTVPLDGVVIAGVSSVNQAAITGESVPVAKGVGDDVYAGTQNVEGYLEVRVTKPEEESTIARVVALVAEAQAHTSPTEAFIERFSRYYTPAIILLAALLVVIPPLAFGVPFIEAFYRALILLVIACPCALAISTPVSMVSGITTAARNGVLIKGRDSLEAVGHAKVVVFDKTGTLTTGRLEVVDVIGLAMPAGEVLRIAASLESRSGHPIAEAVRRRAVEEGIALRDVEEFASITGRGVQGRIGSENYLLGNEALFAGLESGLWRTAYERLENEGKTVVLAGTDSQVIGLIALSDVIRENAQETVAELKSRNIRTVMLTGDNERVGSAVARRIGIDECHAGLLPEEKVTMVERLMERYGLVVMVGDGVNDAPALARANVGVAMGAIGSDVAIEAADIVVMEDDISRIAYLVTLSKKTVSVIRQNVTAALVVKLGIAALAVPGLATLWMAVAIGDMGLSLAVIANALRIGRPNDGNQP